MGRIVLVCRLANRDLRHRTGQPVLLLLAIAAATGALTLGLALHGVTSQPYQQTRAATNGPDIVARAGGPGTAASAAGLGGLEALTRASGVTSHSGPYPVTYATVQDSGRKAGAQVEGRDRAPAPVDQPALTQGTWVRPGQVVLERSFADELGVGVGGQVTLNGRTFRVAGVAATAASTLQYPHICYTACDLSTAQLARKVPGLIWATQADARSLATAAEPPGYTLNLKLADPAAASAFAADYNSSHTSPSAPFLQSWQDISFNASSLVRNEQQVLQFASLLLGLLAIASVAVLAGGRMADQTMRVGLPKAAGGSPGLVAAVLLAEHLTVAVVGAGAGLLAGWLAAPLLTSPGTALLGTAGAPAVSLATSGLVVAVALGIAAVATVIPAIRAARTSTVAALADAVRPPHRSKRLIRVSARLPVQLLLGLRLAARRPRRTLLNLASITVTGSGIVAVLCVHAGYGQSLYASSGLVDPQAGKLNRVLLIFTIALITLAAVNAILITWATVLDTRHLSALTRALGATPGQVAASLIAAQALPALAGSLLGIPGGIELFAVVGKTGTVPLPPVWWLITAVAGTLAAVAALTAVTAWLGTSRRSISGVLQAERA